MIRGRGLGESLPVYVTRENADGIIATYSLTAWVAIVAMLLVVLNIMAWGCIGLYEAVRVVAG